MDIPIELTTFTVSFIIGVIGAVSYLVFTLMAEGSLDILKNKLLPLEPMTIIFVIIGGLVAAIFHTSTGNADIVHSLQNIFMIGFGWQGAITGVGASSKDRERKKEVVDVLDIALTPE